MFRPQRRRSSPRSRSAPAGTLPMDERKRRTRASTPERGLPSGPPGVYSLDIFPALAALFDGDPVRLHVVGAMFDRSRRRPAPICTTCEYEFSAGEAPPIVWALRLEFQAEPVAEVLAGQLCRRCAALGAAEVAGAVIGRLRALVPDLALCKAGRA